MKVNLCGITNEEQLMDAIKLGCDNIGLKVGQINKADDFILSSTAQRLTLNSLIYSNTFLITEYTDIYEVIDLTRNTNIKTIELHYSFPIEDIASLRKNIPEDVRILHLINLDDKLDIENMKEYYPYISGIIVNVNCNTSESINLDQERCLELLQQFTKKSLIPVIIKGNENPISLEATLNIIKPFAVSLDYGKLKKEFIDNESNVEWNQIYNFIKNLKSFPSTIPEKFYLTSQQ